jgi:tetratricopeptide (TPR) repeat protein
MRLGRVNDAVRDLESILKTEDIAPEQKSEALVTRGNIFADLGRWEDAKADLEAVVASEELFPGTRAKALCGLADVARREQDPAHAREYVDMALRCGDADDNSLIDLLIVSGRLSSTEGDTSVADDIWESILSNENATPRQKTIAANRGVERSALEPQLEQNRAP